MLSRSRHGAYRPSLNSTSTRCLCPSSRYKHEHGVVSKQAELRRAEQENLESQVLPDGSTASIQQSFQVVDLKKIVSRLTKNNSELLSIVAEKINYEEKIGGLEARAVALAAQVSGPSSAEKLGEGRISLKLLFRVASTGTETSLANSNHWPINPQF